MKTFLRISLVLFSAFPLTFAQNANIWVDTNGGSCTRQATPAVYNDAAACPSFSAAYNVALGGDTIYVKAGTYGAQSIPSRSLGTSMVTISEAPGENVTTGAISISTNYIAVNGFNLGNNGISISRAGSGGVCSRSHVTVSNNVMAGVNAGINGGCIDTLVLQGNDVSGTNVCQGGPEDSLQLSGDAGGGVWGESTPTNVTLRNNYIHDMGTAFAQCGAHADGFQSAGCAHCMIDGNRWNNTDTSTVIIYAPNTGSSTQIVDITLQNNSVGNVHTGSHGFSIGGGTCLGSNNIIAQNNTYWTANTHDLNCTTGSSNGTARNNLYAANDGGFSCTGAGVNNLVWDRNVYATGMTGCGTNKKNCTASFVDSSHAGGNVDLNSSDTCAKDYVPATAVYPNKDIHATARPQGAAIDAGADEYVGTSAQGPTAPAGLSAIVQ